MKVCYIYRERRVGGYSIEDVFHVVRQNLSPEIIQEEYYVDKKLSWFRNMKIVRNMNADVYHITGDCNYMALGLPRKKTILTVHDIGHLEITLKGIKKSIYKFLWWTLPFLRLDHITTVSKFTKKRLEKEFNRLVSQKVTVIHNPLAARFVNKPKNQLNEPINIIQIGSGKNKNIESLIRAVKELPVKLILVRQPDASIQERLIKDHIQYEWHSNVNSETLQNLYHQADIVFFASTYEGFGLPIIEGQASGRPVITSTTCSMPEVAGSGAYLVDPNNIEELKSAILSLSEVSSWQAEVKRGFVNAKRFIPEKIAMSYTNLYKTVLNGK